MITIYPEDDLVILRFSNYTRNGDGGTVRSGSNYHGTNSPANFDVATFVAMVREALPESPSTGVNTAPTASISPGQVAAVGSRVTLWAGGSEDPDGDRVALDWELILAPTGSQALIEGIGDTVYLKPDMPGDYQISLVVSDGVANSVTVSTNVTVVEERKVLETGTAAGQWPNYAGNLSSNKYSPLDQITADNVHELEVAWRWRSPDNDITVAQNSVFEATPLMIDGVLYLSTSFSQVAALDAATGATLWVHDPQSYQFARPPNNGFLHRGVSYHEDAQGKKIHMPTGDARLIALDAITGEPVKSFGELGNGSVNLLSDIPRLDQSTVRLENAHNQPDVPDLIGAVTQVGNTSPGIVCRNVLVLGTGVHDGEVLPPAPPGDVRGFDLNTGELLWTFHTVPREGEFGTETWGDDSWQVNGNTNVWAPLSADEELGMVYLPVSCPTNNYYGGRRPGDNLFANSILALDCESGQRQWHYQTVHHDIWDYDLPAAPNLIDVVVEGIPVKALAQVSKQGFVYVLNRETGEPVWPIVETPVPQSSVPGEVTSPTQPIPTRPSPFVRQGVVREDFLNPASIAAYDVGPLYTPPSINGIVMTPGEGGGANWGGASYDPTTQRLYVNGFGPLTYVVRLQEGDRSNFYYVFPEPVFGPSTGSAYPGLGSAITAYDMNTGDMLWQKSGDFDQTVMGNAASMISGNLLYYKNSSLRTLNILDKTSGDLLRAVELGGRPTGSPMTYLWEGKQYVVVALGRQDELTELVALALPD
jgi:quinoprotein glucose dehydrogenase